MPTILTPEQQVGRDALNAARADVRRHLADPSFKARCTPEEIAQFTELLLPTLDELESDWRIWLTTLFPQFGLDDLADYHTEYWNWLWSTLWAKREKQPLPDGNAFLAIWGRGCAKTSFTRLAPIAEAALLGEGYCLYLSRGQGQANSHLMSIKHYLETNKMLRYYYPKMTKPKLGSAEKTKAYNQQMVYLASGYIIQAVGLDVGVRGANIADMRVSLLCPDDLDDRSDTVLISEHKMDVFLSSVLPTKQRGTIFVCAQNLVIEHGVFNRIVTGEVPAFATARFSGPHPRVLNLRTENRIVNGRPRDVVLSGTPTWPRETLQDIQDDVDTYTLPIFERECNHNLAVDKSGLVLPRWDERVHVITESEFESIFGCRTPPQHWNKFIGHDWATTKSAYHANVVLKVAISNQNEPLPSCIFLYDPMSFAPGTQADDVAVRILRSITPTVEVNGQLKTWDDILNAEFQRENLNEYVASATNLIEARRAILAKVLPQIVSPLLRRHSYRMLRMSHEAKDARNVYRRVFGLAFEGVNPRREGGIEFINYYLRVMENRRHPFRNAPGWTQMYLIVPDDKYGYPLTIKPDALHDHDLIRYQFRHHRYAAPHLTTTGILEHGPEKMNDDFSNVCQMLFHDNRLMSQPLSIREKIEELIPAPTRLEALMEPSLSLTGRKTMSARNQMAYTMAREVAERQLQPQRTAAYLDDYE